MTFAWASPPLCDRGHGWMAPDHELGDDGKHTGRLLFVCPTCCWSLPRAPPMGKEPPCMLATHIGNPKPCGYVEGSA